MSVIFIDICEDLKQAYICKDNRNSKPKMQVYIYLCLLVAVQL